ncbi:YDG domain-containing protein, partial [Acinetobacter baumannii]
MAAQNKVYDGTTSARVSLGNLTFGDMVDGDELSLSTSGGKFATANAGVGKTVTLQDVELDGADAGNYVLGVP